jgi:signal transduction histidine kinase
MKECAEGYQHTHSTQIQMEVDAKVKSLKLDMKTRHEFFFIFKEALHNIAGHANGTPSLINIDLSGEKLFLKIQNADAFFTASDIEIEQSKIAMYKRAGLIKAELDILDDKKGVSRYFGCAAE